MDTNGAQAYTAPGEQEPSPAEALRRMQQQIGELQAYFAHVVSAKVEGVRVSVRQITIWVVLGVVGLLALAGLLVTALVLLLEGAAVGLALRFGGRLWLGQIVVGVGVLVLLSLGMFIGMRTWQNR